tara:strand:- start:6247 stop:6672 length:426 start_codon:yes stop_codon:yes gene_type:complete
MSKKKVKKAGPTPATDAGVVVMQAAITQVLLSAVRELSTNMMSVMTAVQVSRVEALLAEFVTPLEKRANEVFTKHSGGKEEMSQKDECFPAYQDEITRLMNEELTVELPEVGISLSELGDAKITPRAIGVMLEHGVLVDDS